MKYVDVEEAQAILLQLIDEVSNGTEVIFTRNGRPFVKMTRIEKKGESLRYGSAKGLITMREDFDDPIEDFRDYM
jgi:antitoxin (DNA-binding transcriptional repressor) of toxin-antitoxin stability system